MTESTTPITPEPRQAGDVEPVATGTPMAPAASSPEGVAAPASPTVANPAGATADKGPARAVEGNQPRPSLLRRAPWWAWAGWVLAAVLAIAVVALSVSLARKPAADPTALPVLPPATSAAQAHNDMQTACSLVGQARDALAANPSDLVPVQRAVTDAQRRVDAATKFTPIPPMYLLIRSNVDQAVRATDTPSLTMALETSNQLCRQLG